VPRSILAPFQKFATEGATIGRLLAGYSNLEIGLMHCVQMARGNDFDTVLKRMFGKRGETKRINEAEKLFVSYHEHRGLLGDFRKAIRMVRHSLKIRNQYAHGVWWDDYSGKLAFADVEELARRKRKVRDLTKLKPYHVDAQLLAAQEACFVYADEYLAWINLEGRDRAGTLKTKNPLKKPIPVRRAKLKIR
jgi:hypothetical protein